MNFAVGDNFAELCVEEVVIGHINEFLEENYYSRKDMYVNYLKKNYGDRLADGDINEMASGDSSKEGWTELLSLEERYEMMKSLQNLFFSSLQKKGLRKVSIYNGRHFDGVIAHDDLFYTSHDNIKKFKLSFRKGLFLSEECPICLNEFQERAFIFELPCRHCIHVACSIDWFKQRPVCPMCIRALSVSVGKDFKFGSELN